MAGILDQIYFRPVNPHQFFPSQIHGEEEQESGFKDVLRLVHYYTDLQGRLNLMVVFKRPDEFNADRICAYQAELGDAATAVNPLAGFELSEIGDACEEWWNGELEKVFSGGRRDPEDPRYSGVGEPVAPSGHAG